MPCPKMSCCTAASGSPKRDPYADLLPPLPGDRVADLLYLTCNRVTVCNGALAFPTGLLFAVTSGNAVTLGCSCELVAVDSCKIATDIASRDAGLFVTPEGCPTHYEFEVVIEACGKPMKP